MNPTSTTTSGSGQETPWSPTSATAHPPRREARISLPELAMIAATRGMLGLGAGLLLSGWLGRKPRLAVGTTLVAIGALSTIPLAWEVFGRGRRAAR